ncbi:hypothetical protein VTO42DRAFT_3478 [Malbranchea cinnamomea]
MLVHETILRETTALSDTCLSASTASVFCGQEEILFGPPFLLICDPGCQWSLRLLTLFLVRLNNRRGFLVNSNAINSPGGPTAVKLGLYTPARDFGFSTRRLIWDLFKAKTPLTCFFRMIQTLGV